MTIKNENNCNKQIKYDFGCKGIDINANLPLSASVYITYSTPLSSCTQLPCI